MDERVRKVASYATAVADRYLSARQKLAIMESFLSGDIPKLFGRSYGAHGHGVLALILIFDLIRDIGAFALDKDQRVASVTNIWRLIQDEQLRAALRSKAAKPSRTRVSFDDGFSEEDKARWQQRFDREDIERGGKAFDEAFARVSENLPPLLESELAQKLLTARDRSISHYEMRATADGPKLFPLAEIGLTWGDPKKFMDNLDSVLWDLVLLTTWGSYDVKGFERMHRLYADDFWARLLGKKPVEEEEELATAECWSEPS